MPILLKVQHEHSKKKPSAQNQNTFPTKEINIKQNSVVNQPLGSNIPPGIVKNIQQNQGIIKGLKQNNKQPSFQKVQGLNKKNDTKNKQEDKKKVEKTLKVQIVKKQQVTNQLTQPLQTVGQENNSTDKKSKKKKNKKSPVPEDTISPQQRIRNKTAQLFTHFTQKNQISLYQDQSQFIQILKDSFTPFAINQIQEQRKIAQSGQDLSQSINFTKEYNNFLFDELIKRKRFHQSRIYFGVLQQNQSFSDLIWRKQIQSQPKKQQVANLFNELHLLVINDVWDGQYEIRPTQKASKDQLIYGSYKANQIRMAESIIKQKLSNLNEQFVVDVEGQEQDLSKFNNHKKFDLNSQQTKKAQQFVKKLQQQQKAKKQRLRRQKQQQEQEQIIRLEQERQRQRLKHEQKLQQRRIMLQQKAQQRQREKKTRQQQQSRYQVYLSQHRQRTPLYKKKQQDFKAFLVKQHLRKLQLMKQVQKHKRVISKDEIQIHQIKYKQLKQLLEQERRQMQKLQQQQIQQYDPKQYYRSKFYSSIMSQIDPKTIMEQKKNKAEQLYTRKSQYATVVKNSFAPKIDTKKKEELQQMIKDLAPRVKDDKLIAEKTKMQGQRNLQRLHLFVGELRAKGKIRKHQTPQPDMFQSVATNKSRYTNYLNQLKTTRMKNTSSMRKSRFNSLDMQNMNRHSMGLIQIQARKIEQEADRRSMFLKNTKNLDIEDYLQKKFQLQDDYVESAKAKIKLIDKYRLND